MFTGGSGCNVEWFSLLTAGNLTFKSDFLVIEARTKSFTYRATQVATQVVIALVRWS